MTTNNLELFNSIKFYGRKQYTTPNACLIKFRLTITKGRDLVRAWRRTGNNDLKFHVTLDHKYVLIGGELHDQAASCLISMIRELGKKKQLKTT